MNSPWIYLIIAGIFEWGWPVGLKLAQKGESLNWYWISFAIVMMILSGFFLMIAQKEISIGTGYAVWTGIGAVGTFLIGVMFFGDPATLARFFFVSLIIIGILGLKFASAEGG